MEDSLIGSLVGEHLRITRLLGEGSIGQVYLAEHTELSRLSAVKVLRPELADNPGLAARFRREARATSRLDHPFIVRTEGFGRLEDGRLYLVLEHIEGPDLRRVLHTESPLPLARGLDVLQQIASAVGFAHRQGVVHRDLKPENVLLAPRPGHRSRDHVKILDFGLAKIVDTDESQVVTLEGDVFGTPAYMAPEQCLGRRADAYSDQYALGVIAYEVVAGRHPFVATKAVEYMLQHTQTEPESPVGARPDREVPEALAQGILRCLAKDPAERWSTVEEFGALLTQELERELRASAPGGGAEDVAGAAAEVHAEPAGRESVRGLARRGAKWLFSRYCLVVRHIADRLVRLECATDELRAQLGDAEEAEDQLLRLQTDIAFLEAELDEAQATSHETLTKVHQALLSLDDRCAELRERPPVDVARLRKLEQERQLMEARRAVRELELSERVAELHEKIREQVDQLPGLEAAIGEKHRVLDGSLMSCRADVADPKLQHFYDVLEDVRQALGRSRD